MKKFLQKVFRKISQIIGKCFIIFPVKKNRVYFVCNFGEKYSCNPRAIFECLYQNHKDKCDIVFIANNAEIKDMLPKDVKTAKYGSLKELYYYHTSKVIINNCRFPSEYHKKKCQYYIQAWHGSTIPYKMIEKDVEDMLSARYIKMAKRDSKYIDMIVTGSTACQEIFDNCFYCDKKAVVTGTPRTDELIHKDENKIEKIKERLNINKDDFIVLYAPTFRNNRDIKDSFLNNERVKEAFKQTTNKNVKLLYRFHPNIADKVRTIKFEDDIINVTDYFDIQDLIMIADVMITDFSSCAFDMMFAGKQSLIFTNDAKQYAEQERGLYISLSQLPFMVADNEEDLIKNCKNLKKYQPIYEKKVNKFISDMGCKEDGNASKRLCEIIMEQIQKK